MEGIEWEREEKEKGKEKQGSGKEQGRKTGGNKEGSNPQFLPNFEVLGLTYPPPVPDLGQMWHGPRLYVPNFISIGLLCRPGEANNFTICFYFRHSALAPFSIVEATEMRMHNYEHPKVSRPFQCSNALMAKWLSQTL